jgi:hypothetical protein
MRYIVFLIGFGVIYVINKPIPDDLDLNEPFAEQFSTMTKGNLLKLPKLPKLPTSTNHQNYPKLLKLLKFTKVTY